MKKYAFILILPIALCACSLNKTVTSVVTEIMYKGMPAAEREDDEFIARQAAASMLLSLEAFHENHPSNKKLLTLMSQSYANYAFGFSEGDMLRYKGKNEKRYNDARARALRFYSRGKQYGLTAMQQKSAFKKAITSNLTDFEKSLKVFHKKDVPTLFWTGFNWGGWINLNLDDPNEIAKLARAQAIMERAIELDETFYYGSAHTFFGALASARPKMLGGDPELGKKHFEKALEISNNKYLMSKVLYAQFYAVQIQDKELFTKLLNEVVESPEDILPEQRLANQIAKTRAKLLLERIEEYF